tara:strand:+ start:599 stop:787 length:189 start_codon:yes stop_codon:yes gene_type:complete
MSSGIFLATKKHGASVTSRVIAAPSLIDSILVTTTSEAITYFATEKNITEEELIEKFNITQP